MPDFTIEQLEALKEGTTPGPRDEDVIYPDCSYIVDDTGGRDAALAFTAPALVDALIAEKRAHQELRDRIGRLRDWHNERGEHMHNLYEESLDRQFKDDSDSHSFTAGQLSSVLDPSDEDKATNG